MENGSKRRNAVVVKNAWIYAVVLVVLCTTAFAVARLRLSEIPDPAIGHGWPAPVPGETREKSIAYQVDGIDGAAATLSYFDADGKVVELSTSLPWRLTLHTRALASPSGVLVQTEASPLACRILIDGQIRDEQTAPGPSSAVSCEVAAS